MERRAFQKTSQRIFSIQASIEFSRMPGPSRCWALKQKEAGPGHEAFVGSVCENMSCYQGCDRFKEGSVLFHFCKEKILQKIV